VTLQVIGIAREKMAPASLYVTDSYYVSALGGTGRANHAWVVIDGPKLPEASNRRWKHNSSKRT